MRLRRVRAGELLALAGALAVVISLFEPWYERASTVQLDAWDTFGPAVVLLLIASASALWLFLSTLGERSTALPVAAGVWSVPLGLLGLGSAIVRLIERPDHATRLCFGAWLALAGALAILLGAWLSVGDERRPLYPVAAPDPRPRP